MTEETLTHVAVPARVGEAPHPGLVVIHGRGADQHDLLPLAQALDPRCFVLAVQGPFRFPWGGYAWYDLDPSGVGTPDRQTLDVSLDLLHRFLQRATEHYPIDPARLFAAGFSQGAVMAGTFALLYPDLVAGAAILSGYLPLHSGLTFRSEEAAGHPIFEAHGTLDDVIPVGYGRETRDYLLTTPVDLTYREYPVGHQIAPQEVVDVSAWLTAAIDQ